MYSILRSGSARIAAALYAVALFPVGFELKSLADDTDFAQRRRQIKERFDQRRDKPLNRLVHDPPMIEAADSSLGG